MRAKAFSNGKEDKIRVWSYARWSSDAQTNGDSFRRQLDLAENWCNQRGLTLEGAEKDEGISAKAGRNRAAGSGLSTLLGKVRPGDYLLVEDNDRLSREDWLTASNFIAQILDKGVKLVTLQNNNEIDSERFRRNPGVFLQSILKSFLANDENVKRGARVRESWAARKAAVARGEKPINQNLPCWLRWNRETDQVEIAEEKAAVVRRMFALYLESGSLFHVSRTLNNEGAIRVSRNSNGKGFSNDFVWRCLTNRAALGECMGKPGLFPRLVSDEDFYQVAERLKAGRHNTVRHKATGDNLLRGLAVCSKCGARLHRHVQGRNGNVYSYLICGSALRGFSNCGLSGIRCDMLTESFLGLLLAKDDALLRAVLTGGKSGPSDLDIFKAKLAEAERRAEKILKLIEGENQPPKRLLARLNEIEAEENGLREQIQDEEAKIKAQPSPAQAYEKLRKELPERVKITDRTNLRTLLQDVVERIVVNTLEDSYQVFLKGGREPFAVTLIKAG
jgi:DNA invertase Pin-like site-specific DNA recombinase